MLNDWLSERNATRIRLENRIEARSVQVHQLLRVFEEKRALAGPEQIVRFELEAVKGHLERSFRLAYVEPGERSVSVLLLRVSLWVDDRERHRITVEDRWGVRAVYGRVGAVRRALNVQLLRHDLRPYEDPHVAAPLPAEVFRRPWYVRWVRWLTRRRGA